MIKKFDHARYLDRYKNFFMRLKSIHAPLLVFSLMGTILVSKIVLDADVVETDRLRLNTVLPDSLVFSDSSIVDQFTMTFGAYFLHMTPVLTSDNQYSMVISGTYAISATSALDASYYYCYYECLCCCDSNMPCDSVFQDFRITNDLRPDVDSFRIDHTYYYSFSGADTAMVFEFEDCCYGDNSGSLSVTLYEDSGSQKYIQVDSASVYLRDVTGGIVLRSPDGSCWKLVVNNAGTLVTSAMGCPD